jgi:isocitrate lyase
MGYKFQFITLAGWHLVNYHTFDLARAYAEEGMPAYVRLQREEFAREADGYTATKHQREAGTGYFDQVLTTITGGDAATAALAGSTEAEQFGGEKSDKPVRLHLVKDESDGARASL